MCKRNSPELKGKKRKKGNKIKYKINLHSLCKRNSPDQNKKKAAWDV